MLFIDDDMAFSYFMINSHKGVTTATDVRSVELPLTEKQPAAGDTLDAAVVASVQH